jgi:hypothetical protein
MNTQHIIRAEAAAALAAALTFYAFSEFSWLLFALLFLLPDVSIVGYLAGPQRGAVIYNAVHTYAAPLLLGVAATIAANSLLLAIATIWFAHIAFDRALGYGLKQATGFKDTHLGVIGR